jgi:hypothetical protein
MTPTLLYDIGQAGFHDQIWLFVVGSLFALIWFGVWGLYLARTESDTKMPGYLAAGVGLFFFCVVNYFLVQGWLNRRECLNDYARGSLEVTTNQVTQLRKQGKTPPFRYEFMLGERDFAFSDSPGGVCGFARPPSGMLFLEEGQVLRIEHRGVRIYRVSQMKQRS